MYSFIEYICYDLKDRPIDVIINLTVIEIVINTMFTKNDQKAHGWQFTGKVNYPFSRQFSLTEAHTHQSVSWDMKSLVHSHDVHGLYNGVHVGWFFIHVQINSTL